MKIIETKLEGSFIIVNEPYEDERGLFSRYFCKNELKNVGFTKEIVQCNHSVNTRKGTLRGMHYQKSPGCETKLIKCIRGAVYDVFVDLRKGSSTFLKSFGLVLSSDNMKSVLIPEGFAHGFQTLEDNSELIYHHTEFYDPGVEAGIRYNDGMLDINWPEQVTSVSEKDQNYALLDQQFKGIEV